MYNVNFIYYFCYFLFIKFILINLLLFLGNKSLFFFNEELIIGFILAILFSLFWKLLLRYF